MAAASQRGSSPLTRGKRSKIADLVPKPWLIPAHAGKTGPPALSSSHHRAHPRSRGENWADYVDAAGELGSSPLAQGKHRRVDTDYYQAGLIPAHAGKTSARSSAGPAKSAHPRSRGENGACAPSVASCSGSSPLTRGKRLACPIRPALVRLIPAHAGKTADGERIEIHDGAHPRSRGENRRLADEVEQA